MDINKKMDEASSSWKVGRAINRRRDHRKLMNIILANIISVRMQSGIVLLIIY